MQKYSTFSPRQSPAGYMITLLMISAGPVGTEQAYALLARDAEAMYVT